MPMNHQKTRATIRRIARTPRPLLTPLMLAALGIAGVARAQDSSAPSAQELMQRIEKLEASNRALAGEVQTLRASEGAQWLSEERAAEIRSIVSDTLADSSTRTSLQSVGTTAGWNDGFYMQSADGRFRLEIGGLLQMRYVYSYIPDGVSGITLPSGTASASIADNVETRSGFDLPDTQLDFKGYAFGPNFQYRIRGAFSNQDEAVVGQNPFGNLGSGSGTFRLLDAYVRVELSDEFSVRAGQFKLPFAREQLVEEQYQLAVDRSVIVDHLGLGRSQGVEGTWSSDNARAMLAFSNGGTDNIYGILKAVGSEPMGSNYGSDGVDWAVTGRFEWKFAGQWKQFNSMTSPPGDEYAMMVGVAAHAQDGDPDNGNSTTTTQPNTWYAFTGDVSVMLGGASLFASFSYSNTNSGSAFVAGSNNFNPPAYFDIGKSECWGVVGQASYYIAPKWEVFGRMELGNASVPNIGNISNPTGTSSLDNGNMLTITTIGLNWYIDGQDLKWSTDFGFAWDSVDGVWYDGAAGWRAAADQSEIVFRSQLQLAF